MPPGKVERREFESIRHGTQRLIANVQVAPGQGVAPALGPTRTAADCAAHIAPTVATDPAAGSLCLVDNLTIHQSASLVRLVAAVEGDPGDLGGKEQPASWPRWPVAPPS